MVKKIKNIDKTLIKLPLTDSINLKITPKGLYWFSIIYLITIGVLMGSTTLAYFLFQYRYIFIVPGVIVYAYANTQSLNLKTKLSMLGTFILIGLITYAVAYYLIFLISILFSLIHF